MHRPRWRCREIIVIKGRPITKKNHTQRTRHGATIQSKAYQKYEPYAVAQLKSFRNREKWPAGAMLNLQAHYWMPDRRGWPDLIGLLQATCDILEKAGVVFNDRDIRGFDGSRIIGIDKADPRVEITIKELIGTDTCS